METLREAGARVREAWALLSGWVEAHPGVAGSLVVLSVLTFVASLALLPLLVARLPEDYFVSPKAPASRWRGHHPHVRLAVFVVRNVLGVAMFVVGLAMLALPGQGILTLIGAIVLMQFPGKRWLERTAVGVALRVRRIERGLDWLRRRSGKPPLLPPWHEGRGRPEGTDVDSPR